MYLMYLSLQQKSISGRVAQTVPSSGTHHERTCGLIAAPSASDIYPSFTVTDSELQRTVRWRVLQGLQMPVRL